LDLPSSQNWVTKLFKKYVCVVLEVVRYALLNWGEIVSVCYHFETFTKKLMCRLYCCNENTKMNILFLDFGKFDVIVLTL